MKYLDDALFMIGCGLILVGTYQICPVATWFVGGVMCLVGGVMIGAGTGRSPSPSGPAPTNDASGRSE